MIDPELAWNCDSRTSLSLSHPDAMQTLLLASQAENVTSGAEAPLKLRLTQLGDGGSVLAASNWHGLLDGGRSVRVLIDLSSHYRFSCVRCQGRGGRGGGA